jgi:hypothetical protein
MFGGQGLVDLVEPLPCLDDLIVHVGLLLARFGEPLIGNVHFGLQLGHRQPVGPDLFLKDAQLLLVGGGLLRHAAVHFVGLLLCLGVQRGDLLRRFGPSLADLALQPGPPMVELLFCLGSSRSQYLIGLGLGALGLFGILLLEAPALLVHLRSCGLTLGTDLVGQLADLGEFGLGRRPAILVGFVRSGAPCGQLRVECLRHLSSLLAGRGERFVRLGLSVGGPLSRGTDDRRSLLLCQGQHLLDHWTEVAERCPVDLDRLRAQLRELGLSLLNLRC